MTIYQASENIILPDGTLLANIFSNHQATDQLSLGKGIIPAKTQSKIHIHPVITQATYVLSGQLHIKMKVMNNDVEIFNLSAGNAIVTNPMVSYQIINNYDTECQLLYIVNPSFIFSANEQGVVFNDAIILGECWDEVDEQVRAIDVGWFLGKRKEVMKGF